MVTAAELEGLADDDPRKHLVPGTWYGEALWRFTFAVPAWTPDGGHRMYWRICAIDAAGNERCSAPSLTAVDRPDTCGDGVVDPWERCEGAVEPRCIECAAICGDCIRDPPENPENCPDDGALGGSCAPTTGLDGCGDGICEPGEESLCPVDCGPCGDSSCEDSSAEGGDASATTAGAEPLDGCGCRGRATSGAFSLLILLLRRRRATSGAP